MLGDVAYSDSIKGVKIYFDSLLNILIFKYIHFPLRFICLVHIFLLIRKILIFNYYNDADTDAYACSNKVRRYLRMWILIRMRTGLL